MSGQQYLDALVEERRGYQMRGDKDRVADVDSEIARVKRAMGQTVDPPVAAEAKATARVTRRKG